MIFGYQNRKKELNFKTIYKCQKKLKSQFCRKPEHLLQTVKVNLSDATPFSKNCDDFLGGFLDAKIVKRNITSKIFTNMIKKP